MPNFAECPNQWDPKRRECKAVIETPKGCRNKFKFDPEYEAFELSSVLPEGLLFPYDFGFIPCTLGDDGDPVDVMILMDEPAHVGCLLNIRLIGVIEAEQTEDGKWMKNPRLVGVSVGSHSHENLHSLSEVPKSILDQLDEFFVSYNKSRRKKFKVTGRHGPKRAATHLEEGIAAFEKRHKGK